MFPLCRVLIYRIYRLYAPSRARYGFVLLSPCCRVFVTTRLCSWALVLTLLHPNRTILLDPGIAIACVLHRSCSMSLECSADLNIVHARRRRSRGLEVV